MFKTKKQIIGLISLIIGLTILVPNFVFGASNRFLLAGISCLNNGQCTFANVVQLISNIFNILRNDIAFPLAILMVVYGGALMIFSGGNPKKVANGRGAMTAALVGLAIVVGATLILNTVLMFITKEVSWKAFLSGELKNVNFETDLGN